MEWKPPCFQTARDTLEISVAPVIFSHSSAQALCNSARNVPDQLLKLTVAFSTYVSVSTFGVSGGQEGPGDDQLLLLLHNLFKRFIYNRCDRWANKRSIDGDWICLSTYQPREGGGWHRLRRHRGQLRRHQCVSLVSGWKPSISIPALWQGARGPGGRVQVRQPLLLPLWLRKLDSSWPQEARRTQLPQGLEGSGKGEMMFWIERKSVERWEEASVGRPMRREYLRRKTRWSRSSKII